MRQYTASEVETIVEDEATLSLEALLRTGARRMLQAALEFEVAAYVKSLQDEKDEQGHRQVVRNSSHKPRELITGVGHIPIRQPRVHDRRERKAFSSAILPRYMRRAPSIDALIPALYLKGVSTSSFPEALSAILGENAVGLSPANIVRLKQIWDEEYREWKHRDLSDKHYVYVWADSIYFQVRLEPDRPCVLVIIGATKDGRKELLAIEDGHRESKLSWEGVLTDLKRRGLKEAPALAISAAGCIRVPTCWITSPKRSRPTPKSASTRCICHPPGRMPWAPTRTSCPCMKPDTPRPVPAWKKTRTCCSPFTISQPPTGDTSVPPIPLNPPSAPFATAHARPKDADPEMPP